MRSDQLKRSNGNPPESGRVPVNAPFSIAGQQPAEASRAAVRPLVSIGMPVFNGANLVSEAIDSLLAQSYRNIELVISDNASTDRTQEICERYAAKDPRVHYFRAKENRGLAWNYNRVLELSRGEYFKWAAHDDFCAPDFVERCMEILERTPDVVLCYPQAYLIDENGIQIGLCYDECHLDSPRASRRMEVLIKNLRLSNPIFGVIRADTFRGMSFGNYIASDLVLLAELAFRGKFHVIRERLFYRRDHPAKSNRAHPTLEAMAVLYDPANRGKGHLYLLRLLREYLAAIVRAKMPMREKIACGVLMAKWSRWNWKDISAELGQAGKRLLQRR